MKTYTLINKLKSMILITLILNAVSGCDYINNMSNTYSEKIDKVAYVLINSSTKNEMSILDMKTGRIVSSLKTGLTPFSLASDNNLVLVSNNSGNISVFKRENNKILESIGSIGSGLKPFGIAFNPNPEIKEAYIAYQGDSKILILDTKDKNALPKIKSTFNLQGYSPRKIAVSNDGMKIYITDNLSGKLVILTRNGDTFNKSEISLVSDSSKLLDVSKNEINLDGIFIDKPITLKDSKNQQLQYGTGRIFVANYAEDSIVVIKDDKVETTIPLRENTDNKIGPRNIAIYRNPETGIEKLYVTGSIASIISILDLKALKLIKNISLTSNYNANNPIGITNGILPSGKDIIYVTSVSGSTITYINPLEDSIMRYSSNSTLTDPLGEMITIGLNLDSIL